MYHTQCLSISVCAVFVSLYISAIFMLYVERGNNKIQDYKENTRKMCETMLANASMKKKMSRVLYVMCTAAPRQVEKN